MKKEITPKSILVYEAQREDNWRMLVVCVKIKRGEGSIEFMFVYMTQPGEKIEWKNEDMTIDF